MFTLCTFNTFFKRFKIAVVRPTIARNVLYPRAVDKKVDVVLLRDFEPLGRNGEIVEVPRGFANYRLIPHGVAVYATWENIDTYAGKRDNRGQAPNSDVNTFHKHIVGATKSAFTEDTVDIITSLQVKTFSRDPSLVCTPVSLYRVLDLLSKHHHIDVVPSQVIEVSNEHNRMETKNVTRFTHVGKYYISIRLPLEVASDNIFMFTFKLETQEHHDDMAMESKFQLPKYRRS